MEYYENACQKSKKFVFFFHTNRQKNFFLTFPGWKMTKLFSILFHTFQDSIGRRYETDLHFTHLQYDSHFKRNNFLHTSIFKALLKNQSN